MKEKRILLAIALNGLIALAEVLGGILSGSLALLSDALHNVSDLLSLGISYGALRLSRRNGTTHRTFGLKRAEILAAFLNSSLLISLSLFLFREAYLRFSHPSPIKGGMMLVVAFFGLLANLMAMKVLQGESHGSLNIRSAYLHLLGDTLSSVAVVGGALILMVRPLFWLDPLLTFLIALFILKEAVVLLKESTEILPQTVPQDLDLERVRNRVEEHPEIALLHHVHAWSLVDGEIHFEGHLAFRNNLPLREADQVRGEIEELLKREFGVSHVTLQSEYQSCQGNGFIEE